MNKKNNKILLNEADVQTIAKWLARNRAILVDVRETSEFEQEHIPGAFLVPLSVLNPSSFPHINQKKLVLHCAIGKRSAVAAAQLIEAGHTPPINMIGGLRAWRDAGFETEIFDTCPTQKTFDQTKQYKSIKPSKISPGKVLLEEFMNPQNINFVQLAKKTNLPASHISAIIKANRHIDIDTALKLANYFSTSCGFWLNLQMAYDRELANERSGKNNVFV